MESRSKLLLIVSAMVTLPLFFRGVSFPAGQFTMYIFAGIALLYIMIKCSGEKMLMQFNSPLDFVLPIFFILYGLASFWAIAKWYNSVETIKYLYYFIIYLLVKRLSDSKDDIKAFIQVLFGAASAVSLIGIGSVSGIIPYSEAYSTAGGVINSTLQDPDAFGALMLCGIMLGYGLYEDAKRKIIRLIYCVGGYLLAVGLIFSASRSAWIVFPLVFVIYLVMKPNKWARTAIYSIDIFIPALAMAKLFGTSIESNRMLGAMLAFLFGIAVCVGLYFLVERITRISRKSKKIMGFTAIAVTVAAIGVICLFPSDVLPDETAQRLTNISLSEESAQERSAFYGEVLQMFNTSPIGGVGAGGWEAAHMDNHNDGYQLGYVNSFPVQILLETGIIGMIALLVFFVLFMLAAAKLARKQGAIVCSAVCAAGALLIHSFIGFTPSAMPIPIVLWALVAIAASYYSGNKFINNN